MMMIDATVVHNINGKTDTQVHDAMSYLNDWPLLRTADKFTSCKLQMILPYIPISKSAIKTLSE